MLRSIRQLRHVPIILSEADPEGCAGCSMKVNPANAYRNGPLYPSYTAVAMKAMFDLQDAAKVNLMAMVSWSFEFEGTRITLKDFGHWRRMESTSRC